MLNLQTYDREDASLLERSFRAIRNQQQLQFILEGDEQKEVFDKIKDFLVPPVNSTINLQNLFRVDVDKGVFYIAQLMIDFGYPVGQKLSQSFDRKYHFQAIGLAKISLDLGDTIIQPETKTDSFFDRLMKRDIDIEGADLFNEKYYFVSTDKPCAKKVFDKRLVDCISKYDKIHIIAKDKYIFIGIDDELEPIHSRQIENIFSNFRFLENSQ